MAAVLRDTALYGKLATSKYLGDARDAGQRPIFVPFELIGLSPATLADTYNLCVLKAFVSVRGLFAITDGLGTSVTIALGDAGSAARYLAATSFATTGLNVTSLAVGAYDYRPAADAIVVAVGAGAAVTVGKVLRGHFSVLPPA
jgi:hypothetical protein